MKNEIRTSRTGELHPHYSVPVFFDLENLACKVEIGSNEEVKVHCGAGWENTCESISFKDFLNWHIEESISNHFESKPLHFIRCTNDESESTIAANGELRNSQNHRDNTAERGVSVAIDYGYVAAGAYKYAYFLDGEVVGCGSDGEPLLNPKSIKVVGKMMKRERMMKSHMSKMNDERNKNLLSCGWSKEAFIALSTPSLRWFSYDFRKS